MINSSCMYTLQYSSSIIQACIILSSYYVLIIFFAGLLPVTNITYDGDNLSWNQSINAPPDCITSYTITWDDGDFTTPDSTTSIPVGNIPGLNVCQAYTSISVTAIVPPFGIIQSSGGELPNVAFIPSGTKIIYTVACTHAELTQQRM